MGKYTSYDCPRVDSVIEEHMQTLASLCRDAFGPNMAALVLSGSFGRGEGSVLLESDGMVVPLRDYDTRLVLHMPVPAIRVEAVRAQFMQVTGLGNTDERFSGENGFSLTVEPFTIGQLRTSFLRGRDLRVFDHMNASTVVCGEDYTADLHFPASEIPVVNGLRLLYQKMVGLVGHFPGMDVIQETPEQIDKMQRSTLLYECDKTFVEICTALTLLAGHYIPSYGKRAEQFVAHWSEWFPELAERAPSLGEQIKTSTAEKLRPGSTSPRPAGQAFTNARQALMVVHRYYVEQLYSLQIAPSKAGFKKLLKALRHDYFNVEIEHWLDARSGNVAPARWALNECYQQMLRARMALGSGASVSSTVALTLTSLSSEAPQLDVFLAAWHTLAAVQGTPSQPLLDRANAILDRLPVRIGPVQAVDQGRHKGWDYYRFTRERLVNAYSAWEHGR